MQGSGAGPSSGIPPAVVSATDRPTGIVLFHFTFTNLVYYLNMVSYFINSTIY